MTSSSWLSTCKTCKTSQDLKNQIKRLTAPSRETPDRMYQERIGWLIRQHFNLAYYQSYDPTARMRTLDANVSFTAFRDA